MRLLNSCGQVALIFGGARLISVPNPPWERYILGCVLILAGMIWCYAEGYFEGLRDA